MSTKKILAIDLGAESGRGLIGSFDGDRLALEVVHRFPNGGVPTLDTLHWDVLALWREMLTTLRKAEAASAKLAGAPDVWNGFPVAALRALLDGYRSAVERGALPTPPRGL